MGSAASWKRWDVAQWVKGLVVAQLWLRLQLWLGSDTWPRNSICREVAKKEKILKDKENFRNEKIITTDEDDTKKVNTVHILQQLQTWR